MTTQEQRVEFHKAVMDFKSALKKLYKPLYNETGADRGIALARAELALVECHNRLMDEAATPHTFEVTGGEQAGFDG